MSSAEDVKNTTLVDNFTRAIKKLKIDSKQKTDSATNALKAISEYTESWLNSGEVLTQEFAKHDINHEIKLSSLFLDILPNNTREIKTLKDLDCLLLLFSAFLLHDIGMSYAIGEVCHKNGETCSKGDNCITRAKLKEMKIESIWKDHPFRREHDCRSLVYIEKELIGNLTEESLSAWVSYWRNHKGWPGTGARYALLLVARICESHGESDFLNTSKMKEYERRYLKDDAGNIENSNLVKDWDIDYQDSIINFIMAASSVLCLTDLCDIGPHRMEFNKIDEIRDKLLPGNKEEKFETFAHWVGHDVGKIQINHKDHKILYEVGRIQDEHMLLRLFFHKCGPTKDFIYWGNNEKLMESINKYSNLLFGGTDLKFSSVQIDIWADVDSKLIELGFIDSDPLYEINETILGYQYSYLKNKRGYTFLKHVILRKWFSWFHDDSNLDDHDRSTFANHINYYEMFKNIKKKGFFLEGCFKTTEFEKSNRAYVISIKEHGEGEYYLVDRFLAGNNVALELLKDSDLDVHKVKLLATCRGTTTHNRLREKTNIEENTIIFIFIKRGDEIHGYKNIIDHFKQSKVYLIFICNSDDAKNLEGYGAKNVEFEIIKDTVDTLKKNYDVISKEFFGKSPKYDIADSLKSEQTPASVIHRIFQYSDVSNALIERLESDIYSEKKDMNLLTFVTLLEFICYDGKSVDLPRIKEAYNLIAESLKGINIKQRFEEIIDNINTILPSFIITDDNKLSIFPNHEEDHKRLGKVLLKVNEKCVLGILIQLTVLFRLQALDRAYNINSELFNKHLPVMPVPAFFKEFIMNSNNEITDRLTLAFGMAEALVNNAELNFNHINEFIKDMIEDTGDLGSENDTIIFQIVYRISRELIKHEENLKKYNIDFFNNALFNLGILEALSSGDPIIQKNNPIKIEYLKKVTNFFINEKNHIRSIIMAYDIIARYKEDNKFLMNYKKQLDKQVRFRGWNEICEIISLAKKEGNLGDVITDCGKDIERKEFFDYWKQIIIDFSNILSKTPPWIKPRERAIKG